LFDSGIFGGIGGGELNDGGAGAGRKGTTGMGLRTGEGSGDALCTLDADRESKDTEGQLSGEFTTSGDDVTKVAGVDAR
jgi:hypothetical protein